MSVGTGSLSRELSHLAGIDLRSYRRGHVEERIRRAIGREGASGTEDLVRRLRGDRAARERFRRSIAISVSGLFRDPEQFDLLERELLPPLTADGRRISVWSAGCADGSELYSVALLLERAGALDRSFLLGSDLLEENLATARRGASRDYAAFVRLQRRLRWERRDLVSDGPPPGKWRLILCRNVAIYLDPSAKGALHRLLAGTLALGGVLMLGKSERLADPEALGLQRIHRHVYRRISGGGS